MRKKDYVIMMMIQTSLLKWIDALFDKHLISFKDNGVIIFQKVNKAKDLASSMHIMQKFEMRKV